MRERPRGADAIIFRRSVCGVSAVFCTEEAYQALEPPNGAGSIALWVKIDSLPTDFLNRQDVTGLLASGEVVYERGEEHGLDEGTQVVFVPYSLLPKRFSGIVNADDQNLWDPEPVTR